jgi:Zn-dependent M28 family amino/carboxypeptidase
MAHHDAAPSGAIFDQTAQRLAVEKVPGLFERADTAVPVWWPVVGGPVLAALGAKLRRRRLGLFGAAMSAGSVAAMADIARSPIVAGANDNLSAVAALVGLAERLRDAEARGDGVGVRVLLVSCGAEEVIQGGIHAFAESWFPRLDRERTWFLNLDTIGSPELVSIEGEGPVVMEDYHWRSFRDLIERVAWREGLPIRRGMRARSSTDAVVPSRAGYPTACFVSFDRAKAMPNYHLVTDVPEHLDYDTIARAVALADAVARELAGDAAQTGVSARDRP